MMELVYILVDAVFLLQRFNTWKVRKDLVEVEKVQQRISDRRRTAQLKADSSERK